MKSEFMTFGPEIKVGSKVVIEAFGHNLSVSKMEVEVIRIRDKVLHTRFTTGNAIRPMSAAEKRNTYIVWDLTTGKRVHPTPVEDGYNYFFIPAIKKYRTNLAKQVSGLLK